MTKATSHSTRGCTRSEVEIAEFSGRAMRSVRKPMEGTLTPICCIFALEVSPAFQPTSLWPLAMKRRRSSLCTA
ncbi:hypothetical protein D3C81_1183200 [compost metagenome]